MSASDSPTAVGSGFVPSIPQGRARRKAAALPGPRIANSHPEVLLPHRTARPDSAGAEATPLYAELLSIWAAREATLPGVLDADWRRLTSYRHFHEETEETLRMLRLQGRAHKSGPIG